MRSLRAIAHAFSLLTVIPIRSDWGGEDSLGRAMAAFPLVGALLGSVSLGAAWLLARPALPAAAGLLGAALVLALSEGLTGFLHLDGWADCCDALLPPVEKSRRFEILKDPRLGTFGVAGISLLLLVKVAAVAALLAPGAGLRALLPLVAVPAIARFAPVAGAAALPLARPGGMAAAFSKGLGAPQVVIAGLTAAAAAAPLGWRGAVVAGAALAAAALVGILARRRLGGATGDVYGAMVEIAEAAGLAAAALLQG
jgi:adenosylcobinamide-GDP ribazoletransferase